MAVKNSLFRIFHKSCKNAAKCRKSFSKKQLTLCVLCGFEKFGLAVQDPSVTVGLADIPVGIQAVSRFDVFRVPFEFLA